MSAMVILLLVFAKPVMRLAGLALAYLIVFPIALVFQVGLVCFRFYRKKPTHKGRA